MKKFFSNIRDYFDPSVDYYDDNSNDPYRDDNRKNRFSKEYSQDRVRGILIGIVLIALPAFIVFLAIYLYNLLF